MQSQLSISHVVKRQAAEIGRLKMQLADAQRDAVAWYGKWLTVRDDAKAIVGDESSFNMIVSAVCAEFDVSRTDLMSDRRAKEFTLPRHVAVYLCKEKTLRSLPVIGRFFRRDHSSVIKSCRKIADMMSKDLQLAMRVRLLSERISQRG